MTTKIQEALGNLPNFDEPVTMASLSGYAKQALRHWKQYLPKMYRELEKSGKLLEMAEWAAEETRQAMYRLQKYQKMSEAEAWAMMREEWIYLPPEFDDESEDQE